MKTTEIKKYEEKVTIVSCDYCKEELPFTFNPYNPEGHPEIDLHVTCIDNIVKEWADKYAKEQQAND